MYTSALVNFLKDIIYIMIIPSTMNKKNVLLMLNLRRLL